MFKYKPGDIIIRDKQFYEPNHMMIVYEVRSPREFVVSLLCKDVQKRTCTTTGIW